VAFVVFWHVVDEVHVLNLATREGRRRQGIARILMKAVVDYARQSAARRVLLEVRRSNRAAVELYRALGFWAAGARVRYYQDGEDALELSLSLNRETGAVEPGTDQVPIDE
jgi:ribosomal-protein-alanine N-acetyltransferase